MKAAPVRFQFDHDGRRVRRILLVRLGALGDILLTIPAQQRLVDLFPQATIDWLTSPPYRSLLEAVPGIRRVWTVDTRKWARGRQVQDSPLQRLAQLRREDYDLAVDFQGLLKSSILSRLSGASQVRGFVRSQARESAASFLYTERVVISNQQRHQFARHVDLLSPPRWEGPLSPRFPLQLPAEATEYVAAELRRTGVDHPVLLNPGGGWPTKRWGAERFAELAEQIELQLGLPTLFCYGPGEEELLESVRCSLRHAPLRSFPTSVLQLAALCREASLMVAGDTGPLHLAVGMGTPCVAVLGPADPWRTGPAGPDDEYVLHDRPCPHPYRRRCHDHFCMDIPVERVFGAVQKRLGIGRALGS
jgi:ADP-heptose:LPS heptosyltransferase